MVCAACMQETFTLFGWLSFSMNCFQPYQESPYNIMDSYINVYKLILDRYKVRLSIFLWLGYYSMHDIDKHFQHQQLVAVSSTSRDKYNSGAISIGNTINIKIIEEGISHTLILRTLVENGIQHYQFITQDILSCDRSSNLVSFTHWDSSLVQCV